MSAFCPRRLYFSDEVSCWTLHPTTVAVEKRAHNPRVMQTSEQCQLASFLSDRTSDPQIPFQSPSSIPYTSHSLRSTLFLPPAPAPTLYLHSVLQPLPCDKKNETKKNVLHNKKKNKKLKSDILRILLNHPLNLSHLWFFCIEGQTDGQDYYKTLLKQHQHGQWTDKWCI